MTIHISKQSWTKFKAIEQTVLVYHCMTVPVDGAQLVSNIFTELFDYDEEIEANIFIVKADASGKYLSSSFVVDFESPNRCIKCDPYYKGTCEKNYGSTEIVYDWIFQHFENDTYVDHIVFKAALNLPDGSFPEAKKYVLEVTPTFNDTLLFENRG